MEPKAQTPSSVNRCSPSPMEAEEPISSVRPLLTTTAKVRRERARAMRYSPPAAASLSKFPRSGPFSSSSKREGGLPSAAGSSAAGVVTRRGGTG